MPRYFSTPGAKHAYFRFEATLDEDLYLLDFRWHERASSWYLDIFDENGLEIATGRRVDVNIDLFQGRDKRLPPGYLIAVDESWQGLAPTKQADLGDRVKVVYFTEDEAGSSEESSITITVTPK